MTLARALTLALAAGRVVALRRSESSGALPPSTYVITRGALEGTVERIRGELAAYHQRNPLRRGMSREEVRARLGLAGRPFDEIVARAVAEGSLEGDAETLRLPDHTIRFDPEQQARVDRYLAALRARPHTPPAPVEFGLSPEEAVALGELGEVVRLDDSIVFARSTFAEMEQQVLAYIDQHGSITLAQFRDLFGSSRRYAQVVLESFDQRRVTRRVGDERVRYGG